MQSIAVIIPAYNEQDSIRQVVADVNNVHSHLQLTSIVVNDCSTDDTLNIIRQLNCEVLDLPINLGIGGAVQSGFLFALKEGFDYAVQLDGDGQHPADEIPTLHSAMEANQWDVGIGSRFVTKEGFQSSRMRRTGITYFKWLNRVLVRKTIHDSTSGFRMLNKRALRIVSEYYPDEYPEPEAIVLFSKRGLQMGEIPVTMQERQGGRSSIRSLGALYYMLKVTIAIIFTYIRSSNLPLDGVPD